MTISDAIQLLGNAFIIAGYWIMARDVKWASASLVAGCAVYAVWSLYIKPVALPLTALELTCGVMSARTFWINRRSK